MLIATLLIGCGSRPDGGDPSGSARKSNRKSPVVERHTDNIVNGTIGVSAGTHTSYRATVTGSMNNVHLVGQFRASGGSGNDIIVLVMSEMDYTNYSNGHKASVYYNSDQTTVGSFDVRLSDAGTYFVVYDNNFSFISAKNVATRVDLKYETYGN